MANGNDDKQDRNTVWLPPLVKFSAWLIAGGFFILGAFQNVAHILELPPRLTRVGVVFFIAVWVFFEIFIKVVKPRVGQRVRVKDLGWQVRLFFIGIILTLLAPKALTDNVSIQKVEFLIDVSQHMGEELGNSGITKFEAARTGALEALDYFDPATTQISLRVIRGDSSGECRLSVEGSLLVDFTNDFDLIRAKLIQLTLTSSPDLPLVESMALAIEDYHSSRLVDKKFSLYGFIGGDDTCGKSVELFLRSQSDDTVFANLFLIIMLGSEAPPAWADMPEASFALARSAEEVQAQVQVINREIAAPTPVVTLRADATSAETAEEISGRDVVTDGLIPNTGGNDDSRRTSLETQSAVVSAPEPAKPSVSTNTDLPPTVSATVSATLTSSPTVTRTQPKTPTRTASQTPSATQTASPLATTAVFPTSECPSPRARIVGAVTHPGSATLDTLEHCTTDLTAEFGYTTSGNFYDTPPGTFIWVLVYPWNQGTYYPQSPNACLDPAPPPVITGNGWSVDTYLGARFTLPEWFDIVVVLTDQQTSDFISTWVHTGCPNNYSGIPPAQFEQRNITELLTITVSTKYTE